MIKPEFVQYTLYEMPFGQARRENLLHVIDAYQQEYGGLFINCKHCIQLHQDPDLRKLLKLEIIKRVRDACAGNKSCRTRLVLND